MSIRCRLSVKLGLAVSTTAAAGRPRRGAGRIAAVFAAAALATVVQGGGPPDSQDALSPREEGDRCYCAERRPSRLPSCEHVFVCGSLNDDLSEGRDAP
jgi:hypothetical protein